MAEGPIYWMRKVDALTTQATTAGSSMNVRMSAKQTSGVESVENPTLQSPLNKPQVWRIRPDRVLRPQQEPRNNISLESWLLLKPDHRATLSESSKNIGRFN